MVWLAVGRLVVLRECRLRLVDRTGYGVVWIRVVVDSILSA